MSADVLVTENDDVLTVRLDRPDKYNALNTPMLHALDDALTRSAGHRALVLTGTGKAFAAGADIAEYAGADREAFARFTALANAVRGRLAALPVPVVAAVNGVALGGGFELALSCDVLFAAETAAFGLPETKLGLIPGWGGTQHLTRLLGPYRAKDLVLTGRRLTAHEAHGLGIVHRVTPGDPLEAATAYARELAAGPTQAFAAAKRAIGHSAGHDTGFALEQAELRALFDSHDGKEGIDAFVAKRPPEFQGR
ncbi:enoyl-CoA hydratase/isomerase family protein [Streptomyces sp. NPDC058576]|uniref:enoyl-CoA hydratase/isomerase family protein n=1 Tax=Streptomyces sp. NPDC058576 TaxID=3346547 RepID=UPI00364EC362